jgi:hypothetical protein
MGEGQPDKGNVDARPRPDLGAIGTNWPRWPRDDILIVLR